MNAASNSGPAIIMFLFRVAGDAIFAESALKKDGINASLAQPPRNITRGCELAVKLPFSSQFSAMKTLDTRGVPYLDVIATSVVEDLPCEFISQKQIGDYFMTRVGNMKVTVDSDGMVVNVSGGGCPDVLRVARLIIGKKAGAGNDSIKVIEDNTHSLCGYLLKKALIHAGV